jgi:enamine deaminase RidA (YjgF/YER057c/UK114 family)
MPREDVNPAALHPAPGFSHVSVAGGSRLVFFAGQVALDAGFGIVGGDDIVRRTIYTLHPAEYEVITAAIDELTGGASHPAQTIVGVTGLAVPGLLIEIECTAALA